MKYFYLRDEDNNPVACVASYASQSGGLVFFGVSTWNPADRFDKNVAKQVAEGRAKSSTSQYTHLQPQVKRQICQMIATSPSYPTKTKNAAKLWLAKHRAKEAYNHEVQSLTEAIGRIVNSRFPHLDFFSRPIF